MTVAKMSLEFCSTVYAYIKEFKRNINLFNGREILFERVKSQNGPPNKGLEFIENDVIEILDKLDIRLANGEISEETYKLLTKKWNDKLNSIKNN